ncbi:thioredoxin [Planoprotostelium fungivorum]|uniref:protein-disulfide reductase n=1 Tax=Planoprotostelium fungivorum TaxID=1890364 RepID=A0A2P6NNE3_9EUKA|nr:thioredoxin [Planoprotostelium fungivorum]
MSETIKISTDDLQGKIIAVYFSAHWCGPCRQFTPLLIATYQKLKEEGKPFEVVFISNDKDQAGFKSYFSKMPWKAVDFADEERRDAIGDKLHLKGLPTLIVLNSEGKVLSKNGQPDVTKLKEKAFDVWSTTEPKEKGDCIVS